MKQLSTLATRSLLGGNFLANTVSVEYISADKEKSILAKANDEILVNIYTSLQTLAQIINFKFFNKYFKNFKKIKSISSKYKKKTGKLFKPEMP